MKERNKARCGVASFACAAIAVSIAGAAPVIVPAPREMSVTGGECRMSGEPKVETVAGIPPEGYELSVTKDGVTIRSSDAAGAFYARMTLAQIEQRDAKTKAKVYPCLEIRDAPQYKWRGVLIDDCRHFFGKIGRASCRERV